MGVNRIEKRIEPFQCFLIAMRLDEVYILKARNNPIKWRRAAFKRAYDKMRIYFYISEIFKRCYDDDI